LKSFEKIVYVLTEFSKISGLKLNTKESTVLRVGSLTMSDVEQCKHKNSIGQGIHLESKLRNVYNPLKQCQHRKLTLMGNVTVIKTFALHKLLYPFSV
jgi:hypothetical protein